MYLPEGTWIDYNNKHTAYSGEQWMTVDSPQYYSYVCKTGKYHTSNAGHELYG